MPTTVSGGLTFTNPPASMNGYQYRCVISGTCSPSATTNAVTLTVNTQPAINTQPVNLTTVCETSNTSFYCRCYRFKPYLSMAGEHTGSGFVNTTNTGVYSGATLQLRYLYQMYR